MILRPAVFAVSPPLALLCLLGCAGRGPGPAETVPPPLRAPAPADHAPAAGSGAGVEIVSFDSLPPNHLYPGNRYPLAPQPFRSLPPDSIEARGWLHECLGGQIEGLAGALLDSPERAGSPGSRRRLQLLRALVPLSLLLRDAPRGQLARREVERFASRLAEDDQAAELEPALVEPALSILREHFRTRGDWRAVRLASVLALRVVESGRAAAHGLWQPADLLAAVDALRWAYNESGDRELLARATEATALLGPASSPRSSALGPAQELLRALQLQLDAGGITASEIESTWTRASGAGTVGGSLTDLRVDTASMAAIVDTVRAATRSARLTALVSWMERLERVTFNALLGASREEAPSFPRQVRSNQTDASYVRGPAAALAWAEYGSRLWVAAPGDGLAALSYAPCIVRCQVGEDEGTSIRLHVRSSYPFEERVEIEVEIPGARRASFPLGLPVPAWCSGGTVSLNRRAPVRGEAGEYLVLRREWRDGDRLAIALPMSVRARRARGGVAVELGPLIFSLPLDRDRDRGVAPEPGRGFRLNARSVPDLLALASGPERPFRGELLRLPFSSLGNAERPLRIRATLMPVLGDAPPWTGLPGALAGAPLPRSRLGSARPRTLVPWGLSSLRLAAFPWSADS